VWNLVKFASKAYVLIDCKVYFESCENLTSVKTRVLIFCHAFFFADLFYAPVELLFFCSALVRTRVDHSAGFTTVEKLTSFSFLTTQKIN